MKNIYTLLIILFAFCAPLSAQVSGTIAPAEFFDPERNPVAVRSDTTLQLVVSEYVLIKSVTARLGKGCQVNKMSKIKSLNGMVYLIFEGNYSGRDPQPFALGINLVPDTSGKFYYGSNEALVCEKAGCSNCGILNGACTNCCAPPPGNGSKTARTIAVPMLKVTSSVD